tara:strand:+ start:3065 stop:4183 length:1119 start_codon:yes stop_codon:yes gene_type:complete
MRKINFYEHDIKKSYKDVNKSISSLFLTSGPITRKVEKLISKRFNKKYCYLTNSWTNGVISLLLSLNLKKDDEVIIPANTFVACANVVEMIGCKLVMADIDEKTKLLSISSTLKKITKKTKLIMPVHLYGNIFNVLELKKKIRKNIFVLEDCAHCFSGYYQNKIIGSSSDFAVFSFYATKNITCGEGGAIILNNKYLYDKIKSISNNGMTKPAMKRFENNKYSHWDVITKGFKANMSDINASLLEKQIKIYDKKTRDRIKIYEKLYKKISNIKQIILPVTNSNVSRDYHLFPIGVSPGKRDKLISFLNKNNIQVTVNYRSITELTYYKKKYRYKCKFSEKWGQQTLSLPFHLKINDKDLDYIYSKLNSFFKR